MIEGISSIPVYTQLLAISINIYMSLLCRWLLARFLQIRLHITVAIIQQAIQTDCTVAIENYNTYIIRSS